MTKQSKQSSKKIKQTNNKIKQTKNKPKQPQQNNYQQILYPNVRKVVPHVIQRKKKRVNSLVRMKPLKIRQNYLGLPEFCPKGYTKQEFDLYKQQYARIFQLNRDDLREILKLNKQVLATLSKLELLNRCADGYALGKIPICPHCFGANPIYEKNKGNYFCPGYKENQQFITCESYFNKQDLPRIKPWNTNFQERQRIKIQRTQQKLRKQRQYQTSYKINKRDKLKKKNKQLQEQQGKAQSQADQQQSQQIVLQKQQDKNNIKKQEEHQYTEDQIKLEAYKLSENYKINKQEEHQYTENQIKLEAYKLSENYKIKQNQQVLQKKD